ncbi:AMP-binding protein [Bacteroides xylanisolvens]|nr:AMP-binding protein [Bacteroides xylanisolvens]
MKMNTFNNLVLSRLSNVIAKYSDSNCFCIDERFYTYHEFASIIARIREALTILEKDDLPIGLVNNNDIYTYASIFALWYEGLAYVPLHPMQPKARCMDIIEQVGISLVIDSSQDSRYDKESMVLKPDKLCKDVDFDPLPKDISDEKLTYILFTSGSTGKPKGVQLSRKNIAAFVSAFEKSGIQLIAKDRCLQCFDLTFDVSVQSYLMPLLNGACVYTLPLDCMKYAFAADLIERYELTFAAMAPSMVRFLRPYFLELNMDSLKYCILTAEASNFTLVKDWGQCAKNAQLYDFYGPTEATIYCTYYKLPKDISKTKNRNDILFIGKPMDGIKAIIVNAQEEILTHEIGELCVAGDQLTAGYWKMPEKNEEVFFEKEVEGKSYRFYKTGDLCRFDEDGDIEYIGRIDFQAKVQGYRVELGEIECRIREVVGKDIVALAIKDDGKDDIIVAFVESDSIDFSKVQRHLRENLPSYMIPRKIITLTQFPLNNNGKIDRKQLTAMYNSN